MRQTESAPMWGRRAGLARLSVRLWRGVLLWALSAAMVHTATHGQQATSAWVVGGRGGDSWSAAVQRWIALDDSTRPGALQLREIPPDQDVLRERVTLTTVIPRNIFGYRWSFVRGRYGMEADTLQIGWYPRLWQGGAAEAIGIRALVDGDELTTAFTLAPPSITMPSANTWLTLDLGVPLAIDSVVFFPPQNGLNASNQRLRDLFPEAYEVSRTTRELDWLLFEDETTATGSAKYHPLDDLIASTFSNNQSIVGLGCPLRFTRFLRLKFGGVRSTGVVSEIKAYGRGYPAEGRYVSLPHSFGQPVSFGRIGWRFTKYRKLASGEIVEDPNAPVELAIRTRSGTDADPTSYFVYDELGRAVAVDQQTYYAASPVAMISQDGLPNFRAARGDDIDNWNAWSIVYQQPGEQIRSSDGRQYLQFRIEITTAEPLAFGVLDSLACEISPLLADSVLAEVSLAGQPDPTGRRIEVPLGVDTAFVYDLRTVFRDRTRPGFDEIDLDVPLGTRFQGLEIDGAAATEGQDFSLLPAADGRLSFAFPKRIAQTTSFRVRFRGAVYQSSVFLGGQILDRDPAAKALPQSIEGGDARPDVHSDGLQVVAAQAQLQVLGDVRLSPAVFTPNGDGRNDAALVNFAIFGVEQAQVKVEAYDLGGRLIAVLMDQKQVGAGHYLPTWNGKDANGALVPPGLYLVRVEVAVDEGTFARVRPVAVVY